jgi:hypothetical protein
LKIVGRLMNFDAAIALAFASASVWAASAAA